MRTDLSSISKISRMLVNGLILIASVITPLTQAGAQDFTARFMADYGNVTVMEVTGNFDAENPDGSVNAVPRQRIANEFFRTHKDEYDFVSIFTNFDYQLPKNAVAFYSSVKNDIQGIGQEIYDNSLFYGSNGKLQGTIDMGNLFKLATNPLDPKFDFTSDIMVHETLHRWGAFVHFKDWNGAESKAILGYKDSHWSFLFDSGGSTHLGNKWRDNGDGTFTSTAVRKYYSPLDLYLMGMIDKSKVPPTLLIDNPAIDPDKLSELGSTISGIARFVTVDDIIGVEGEHIPSANDSQKQFKTAFIYVATPGTFKADDLPALENIRNAYLTRFSILTDGKGLVQVACTPLDNLPANPGVHTAATVPRTLPPNINDGLNWLINRQQADGSWTDFALTTERDTAETVATLQLFPTALSQFQTGLNWLGANGSTTTDYLARRIEARVHAGSESTALAQELLARRNSDGGWGGGYNFVSSPTDTALALKTLAAAGYNDQTVTGKAIAYLQSIQNPDGGWSGDTSASIIQPTAAVLSAYNAYRKNYDLEIGIGKGVQFLASKQNSDGGFGNSPSTVYDSSLALMALQSLNTDKTNLSKGMNYILGQQSEDGSWNESPFQTALSMRAIWQATVEPDLSIKAEDIAIIPATITALPTNAVLSATIQNLGRSDVSQATVSLFEGSIDPDHKLAEQTLAFPGQSSVTVTFSIPVTSATGHIYHMVVDPDNRIKESNKDNNRAAKSLLPEITYDFQVISSDISVAPNPVDAGNDVKIALKVSNRGTSDAYNVPVRLFIDQAGSAVEIAQVTVDIPAGGSVSREVTWRASLAGVNLPLTVLVDPDNTVKETSKDNNKASVPLTVNASTLPNLSVSYKDMVLIPSPAREGGNVSISVLVKNDGFSMLENVKVNIYKGLAANDGTLLSSQVIPLIPIGQPIRVATEWQGIAEYGERIISVQVGSDNSIQEISKDDDFAFTTLNILSLPDLAISDSSIVINPAAPRAGDPVSVAVTVQNAGDQEARDVTVQLKEGGTVVGSTVIPLINGNSQASSAITYSNSAQTGSHQVAVVVDPDNAIVERTKDNNGASKSFTIQNANLWLSEAYISPNGDGIKDSTDFFFRLAAAAKVTVQVINKKNVAVRTFSGGELDSTTGTTITWDGKNDAGSVVDDGTYQIKVINATSALLASLPMEVDTNRSPLAEALGTKYLLQNNQTCMLPYYSDLKWLPDESGFIFKIHPDANSIYPDGIYSMSPNGDDILRLVPNEWNSTSNPDLTYTLSAQDVSPDGQRVVFNRTKTTRTFVGNYWSYWGGYYAKYDYSYAHSTWLVDTDGINLTQLTDERVSANINDSYYILLKWSPDGKRIGVSDTSGLRVLNPETKVISSPISKGTQNIYSLSWSPDGTKLLASFYNSGGFAVSDNNGVGGFLNLNANLSDARVNGWMNGNKILMSAYDNSEYNNKSLLLDPVDGSTKVVNVDDYMSSNIIIGPDHNNLAIIRDRNWNAELTSISIVDITGKTTIVAEQQPDVNAPVCGECNNLTGVWGSTWSQDGSQLAYISTHYDENEHKFHDDLVVYDIASGSSQRLALADYYSESGYVVSIIWMKDKSSLLVTTVEGTFLLNLSDGSRSDFLPIGTANFFELSPTERYLTYEQYSDSNTGCFPKWNNQWAISSLLNLTADLRIAKAKTFVTLRGVAADKNFEGYRLEYADYNTPDAWNLVTPPSNVPVLDGSFTTWVPPYEGTFLVRLTVWDKAGNLVVNRKRLNWGMSSAITNMYKSEEFISPNGDGVKETVELHYQVLEPVHLEFNVYDSSNNLVMSFSRSHTDPVSAFIKWDGKDSAGRVVPDGQYRISVFDFDFFVTVDATLPSVSVALDTLKIFGMSGDTTHAKVDLFGHASDKNIKTWLIEFGYGDNPVTWYKLSEGREDLGVVDDQVIQKETTLASYIDNNIGFLKEKRFRITAEDFAGNRTSVLSEYAEERIMFTSMFTSADFQLQSGVNLINVNRLSTSSFTAGTYVLLGIETGHLSTTNRVLQYKSNSQWYDSQAIERGAAERGDNHGLYAMELDTKSVDLHTIDAIRMKMVDVLGSEHFSSEIALVKPDFFGIDVKCDQSLKVQYDKMDALGSLTLQLSKDSGITWIDVSSIVYDNAYSVDDERFGVPEVPAELYNPLGFDALKVRMVAKASNGVVSTSNVVPFPRQCKQFELDVSVSYEEATICNRVSPGKATVTANVKKIDGYQLDSLKVTIKTTDGKTLPQLQDFGRSLEGSVTVDTSSLSEGSYPVTATALFSYVSNGKVNHEQYTSEAKMIVNHTLPEVHFGYPSGTELSICPVKYSDPKKGVTYGVALEGSAASVVGISHYDVYKGPVANPVDWDRALRLHPNNDDKEFPDFIHGKGGITGQLGTWDVTGFRGNTYALQLRATDKVGNLSCTNTSLYLNEPVRISAIAPDRQLLSSVNGDTVGAGYQLTGPATIGTQVFPVLSSLNLPDTLGTPVMRNITDNINYLSGIDYTYWDGRNDGGATLSDGKYGLTLNSVDACQLTDTKWATIEIDNTPPVAAIGYPRSIDPLPTENVIEIKGTATDQHFRSLLLEAGEGASPSEWILIGKKTLPVSNNKLAAWNTFGRTGQWTLRLTVEDAAGNTTVTTSFINLGIRKDLIKAFTVTPDIISPNGDQRRETTHIAFEVTDACQIKVDVVNATDTTIKTFVASTAGAGIGSIDWDGKINLVDFAPDGTYTIRILATLTGRPEVSQTENVSLIVDTIVPQVTIPVPADKAYYNKTQMSIFGSITDPNLTGYSLSVTGPGGTSILDSGNQNRTGYTFGSISDMIEDTYTLTIDASDQGENRVKSIRAFTIDHTPPKVTMDTPKSGEFYGNTKNIDISGAIVEKNLERYSLRYGTGETPTVWQELIGADTVPSVSKLFSWKVGKDDGIVDGIYTLSLYAKDKAGLEGEVKAKVVVDNTLPEVVITQPINGGYLTKATDIKGTLSDTNLDKGLLELTEGGCATANKWATVKAVSTPLQNGVLDSWKLLPNDGEYCLRLSASDKSGNKSETKTGIKIDTHPPTPPQLTGKTENKTTNSLSWTKSPETDVAGYNMYRTGQKLNTALITDLFYSDADLTEGSYSYTIKAVDLAGNESDPSNVITLKVDLTGPMVRISTPSNGAAVSNLIDVKGTAYGQDDFKEYRVYIGQGSTPSSWTLIRRSPLPTSYGSLVQWDTITGQEGSQYTLKLEGEDTSGNISTAQSIVTIDNTPPKAPELLVATATGADVALTWKSNTETDLAGYLLYRNDQLANVKGVVADNLRPYLVAGTTYTDKALVDGTYNYYLVAMDQAGNSSDQSNTLEVTIDTRPPHMTITAPASGQKFDGTLMINAETPDNDIATVQFQYKRSQDAGWTNLGAPLVNSPFIAYLDSKSLNLVYGDYQVQVLATDKGGKSDPAPPSVTVSYADLTPPDVPSGLAAKANAADVNLIWNAVNEADVNYNVYRLNTGTRSKINDVPVTTASFADINISDGTYQYEITSIDVAGNESKASEQVTAKIYAPLIVQPYTPVKVPTLNLTGKGVAPNAAVEITMVQPSGETAKVTVLADVLGDFKLEGITLALGETSFSAVTLYSNGNSSKKSEIVYVAYGNVPAVPTGLVSTVQAKDVTLNWNANSETDVMGYHIFRDGVRLNDRHWVQPVKVTAINEDSPAVNASDNVYNSYWSNSYSNDGLFSPVWWQMTLLEPELINELDLNWLTDWDYNGNQILYAGKDFVVQAWSGHNWVTIKTVAGNDQPSNNLLIDPPYRTDRLRLLITATTDPNNSKQVRLVDAYAYAADIVSSPTYLDINTPDGKHLYEVSAVNQYGFVSDRAATNVKIGAFPQVPTGLAATVQGSDVVLNWNLNSVSDSVSYYNLQRWNGEVLENNWWVNANTPAFTDSGIANGTYRYRISALMMGSNGWLESDFSDYVSATVAVTPPATLTGLTVVAPLFGRALDIKWQPVSDASGYNLYRAVTSGGPYVIVRSWLYTSAYRDGGLIDGTSYFYVMTVLDSVGNESVFSAEAFGTPMDQVVSPPSLFKPTLPGKPVTVFEDGIEVAGFAEPGADVDIRRDGIPFGAANALSMSQQTDKTMSLDSYYVSLSPDRRLLASAANRIITITDFSNDKVVISLQSPIEYLEATPLWSPSGRYVLFAGYDTDWNNRIALYDRETQQMQVVSTGVTASEKYGSWSPSSDSFVFVGGSKNLWFGSPTDGSLVDLAGVGYAYYPRISPDNSRIAYFDDDDALLLLNRSDGSVTMIDDHADGRSSAWSPDGSKLAYISYRDGDGDIYSYSVSSGEITRRTYSQQDGGSISWSPDGSQLGYRSYPGDNELFTVVDVNGSEQTVFTASGDMYGIPGWRSDGDIITFDQLGLHSIKPAGYFSSTVTGLTAGENSLTAVATDQAGNISIPSEAITVVLDTGKLPDLTITDSDITFFPPVSKPGEETLVTARVRNLAGNAADNVKVELYLWDGANDVATLASETISHIDAYGEANVAVRFNTGTAIGIRTVIAVVDPSDAVQEILETNNYASKDLVITNLEGVQLAATLSSLQYTSRQELSANIALLNSGQPTSGVLSVTIEDAAGIVVKQLAEQARELPYGLNESLLFTWNTGATFAGNYRLHVVIKDGSTVLAEDTVSFTLLPDLKVTAGIVTERQQYGANQIVGISTSFTNAALNYLIPQLKASVRIYDAQNTQLFSGEQSAENIMPGMSGALDFTWNSGLNAPGNYTTKVEYSVGDQVAGNASTVFSIIPVVSVTGSLKAASNIVQPGDAIAVSYTLSNNGNSAATGQATLALVDPDSLSVIATVEQAVSIPMGGAQSGPAVFSSSNLLLKPYLVTLAYVSQGGRTPVGSASISIKDGIPPVLTVVSPLSGERFTGDVSISVLAADNASGVARVEYSRDGGTWNLLPPADQAAGRYGFAWTPIVAESGAHSVSFRGTDRAGNTSTSLVVSYTIQTDITPPTGSVVINGGAGVTASRQVMLSLVANDESGISYMRLSNDGSVWSDQENYATTRGWFLAPGDGLKRVYVSYQDVAGNWSVVPIVAEIVLDTLPPTVSASPVGTVYSQPRSVTLFANESAVIRYTVDGSAPNATSAVYQAPIQIASDTTLRFMASDSVGNQSDIKTEIYVIDTIPPSLTVSTLADGSYTNNQVLNIAGMATDSSGIVSLALNGADVPQNPDGSFSHALVLQSGPNAVSIVATDLVGNSSMDNRTINLDMTAPLLTVSTPADNAKSASANMNVTGTVDETSTVKVKLGADIQQAAMNGSDFGVPVGLIPGINTIDISATDVAGNTSTQKRTVIYDDQKPSLAVSDPPQDFRTNQSGLILRGTVSDLYTQVGVTATMDGQSYTPPVIGGAFEQQFRFIQEKSYAIVVTATNEVGSSTTTQRNVIFDITPPTLAINAVQSPTTANSVLISGTREADVAVSVTCPTATVGTIVYPAASSWQVQLSAMPLGEHIVTAQTTDAANNTSTASVRVSVQQSGPDIVLTPSPTIIWPPSHKMVPVTINGVLNVPLAEIKSLKISLIDEYGEYNFVKLKLGSTVYLEAWRNGNDPDGRKYTFSAVLTRKNGSKTTATAVVLVPHDMSGNGKCNEDTHERDGDDDHCDGHDDDRDDDHDDESHKHNK